MRKVFFIILILLTTIYFATIVKFGDKTCNIVKIDFESIYNLLNEYSSFLNFDMPSTGTISSFKYIEWKGKFISFSNNVVVLDEEAYTKISFDDILNFFGIRYIVIGNTYQLAEMLIEKVSDFGGYIQIIYFGKDLLNISKVEGSIVVNVNGLVYFEGKLYKNGDRLFVKKVDGNFEVEINKIPGRIIIQFVKEYEINNLIIKLFGEKITSYDSKSFALIFKDSKLNTVFVGNYTPDFSGNDWNVFSISDKFGKLIAERFNLKIRYLSFVQLPKDLPGIVIFTPSNIWKEIEKFLQEEIE
ncbi:hypothetical protein SU69_08905 [Thermosipho melanesiensis]|uniref:Uncharacterized protein n=2 Tax=Thermosipho melanesiensis TaxID=46541 RepID=A6LNV0_THEM4|nr:DUF4941 domain-containing protein [Thermosipho melanesiensis]ABR31601.1 hypothetical protein Tmel_1762 [Thermosipho melanesiensis BI429]APT74632.1 hypothetical protein BW47_09280 [Thermosipho melanesiensis]OOC35337.1 hypothetical protein SU69_08905 [Thermosipho melanesiensis]OOC35554.1 hypothetical protein SU70_08915 [Thermosipho melanesiensis]OOC36591.1 hypothetical protein SU68_08970 [Thermosipho melanesiensis]